MSDKPDKGQMLITALSEIERILKENDILEQQLATTKAELQAEKAKVNPDNLKNKFDDWFCIDDHDWYNYPEEMAKACWDACAESLINQKE